MTGYSECVITLEKQLMPATIAIWRAHQLFTRGQDRIRTNLSLTEDSRSKNEGWLPPKPKDPGLWCGTPYLEDLSGWYQKVKKFADENDLIVPEMDH